ncbi:MAG: NAD(P)/FAD-dependent oxidoreductase [Granulosicoccus sp.]
MANILTNEVFDLVVIGAGVVGCAVARRLTLAGARVAVIEKATDILDGASKANSAILHTGFDAPENSLEVTCIREGYREYKALYRQLGLTLDFSGAHVVAWTQDEVEKLENIAEKARNNDVEDVNIISAKTIAKREVELSDSALGALSVPGECLIDPWSAPYVYLRQSLENGGKIFLYCEVTSGNFDGESWKLDTTRGSIASRYVVNCAGLYGDRVDQRLLGSTTFNIAPRKGQFVVFDKAAGRLANSIILPVPTSRTKGVVVCRTVFGNLLVGPTAEDQQSRSDASTDEASLRALIASGVEKIPALKNIPVTAVYAGLRPACEHQDYQIEKHADRNWITVGAIRSTGLSGALGIATHVLALYEQSAPGHTTLDEPVHPQAAVLAQNEVRDWQREHHGDIVCHCELVSEREINRALEGPLAARSLAGLKRQTRVTMGRCQGFYCRARLETMCSGKFDLFNGKEAGCG